MSGLENISDQELIRLAEQAHTSHELEHIHPLIQREMAYRSFLLSNGVYDASLDEYDVTERPDDVRWAKGIEE